MNLSEVGRKNISPEECLVNCCCIDERKIVDFVDGKTGLDGIWAIHMALDELMGANDKILYKYLPKGEDFDFTVPTDLKVIEKVQRILEAEIELMKKYASILKTETPAEIEKERSKSEEDFNYAIEHMDDGMPF